MSELVEFLNIALGGDWQISMNTSADQAGRQPDDKV